MKRFTSVVVVVSLMFAFSMLAVSPAFGQDYPEKPVRFVVPYNPGGSYDTIARLIAQKLSEQWKQPVLIENRPGAGSLVGTELASRADADGYTIVIFGNNHAILPSIHKKASFNVQKDFAPVSLVAMIPALLLVNPSVPANSVAELVALAKAKPGQLNFGSGGNGSSTHLGLEMFRFATNIDIVHIPYKAGVPATMDLIAGQTQIGLLDVLSARQWVESGKLRPLAITTPERSPFFPNVMTMAEAGVSNYSYMEWYGITVRTGTPIKVIGQLNAALKQVINEPAVNKRLREMGATPVTSTPEEFAALFDNEIKKNAEAVRRAGVKRD
jgi:tripartite-type tricarboxylate transporter receptor subunit TctC